MSGHHPRYFIIDEARHVPDDVWATMEEGSKMTENDELATGKDEQAGDVAAQPGVADAGTPAGGEAPSEPAVDVDANVGDQPAEGNSTPQKDEG